RDLPRHPVRHRRPDRVPAGRRPTRLPAGRPRAGVPRLARRLRGRRVQHRAGAVGMTATAERETGQPLTDYLGRVLRGLRPLPATCDVVVPALATDQGMAAVEIQAAPKKGHGVRRAADELPAGAVLATAGTYITPALVAVMAATGIGHVVVRPCPRVVVVATGDELVDAGRASQPGQVVDVNSHALTAAAAEAGAHAYRVGICDDDPEAVRGVLDDQTLRADLIITTGG